MFFFLAATLTHLHPILMGWCILKIHIDIYCITMLYNLCHLKVLDAAPAQPASKPLQNHCILLHFFLFYVISCITSLLYFDFIFISSPYLCVHIYPLNTTFIALSTVQWSLPHFTAHTVWACDKYSLNVWYCSRVKGLYEGIFALFFERGEISLPLPRFKFQKNINSCFQAGESLDKRV